MTCEWKSCPECKGEHHYLNKNGVYFGYCSSTGNVILMFQKMHLILDPKIFDRQFITFLKTIQTQTANQISERDYFIKFGHYP